MHKPVLVFAYGNLSRGDDALGPLLLEHLEQHLALDKVELLSDFQLQVEHALDLENRELVLFVDASVAGLQCFDFSELAALRDKSYSTHAMSPAAVLAVYGSIQKKLPPPCFLLSITGEQFELGESLSSNAQDHLGQACEFAERLLGNATLEFWRDQLTITS